MTADRYFTAAGVPIRYVDEEQGEPVVLVHSYTSDLDAQWRTSGVLPSLSRSYRTIAFDVRGHGNSGKPHAADAYGPEMARDVVRLLDHLGIACAHVVGYSMGAHIVAQLLALAPERFVTATLGGASGGRDWSAAHERQVEIEAREMEQGLLTSQILRLWPADRQPPTPADLDGMAANCLAGNDALALAAIRRSNSRQMVTTEQLGAKGCRAYDAAGKPRISRASAAVAGRRS